MVHLLPVKEKKIQQRERFFNYIIVEYQDEVYVKERTGKDIWQNLYEFILIETESIISAKTFLKGKILDRFLPRILILLQRFQKFSIRNLLIKQLPGRFFHITLKTANPLLERYKLVPAKELRLLPFPKFITSYLKD